MSAEIDLDSPQLAKPRRPWLLASVGLLTIAGLIAMPLLAGLPDGEKLPDIVRFIGRFHPVVLHLPIGIFALIVFQELLAMVSRKKPEALVFPMFIGTASAIAAALLGFLLYQGGGFEGSELVENHLWSGIGFACAATFTLIVRAWTVAASASQIPFRALLFSSVGAMGYASHGGASITHGTDYLTEFAPDPIREVIGLEPKQIKKVVPAKSLDDQVVYTEIVAPILEKRCVECHKEGKSKGKFRMDTFELLVKGGKEGEAIVPGSSAESNIIIRPELPEDDDEHMPPDGKTGIEAHELAIVKWWIDQGADPAKTLGQLEITEEVRTAIGLLDPSATALPTASKAPEKTTAPTAPTAPSEELLKTIAELSEEFPGGLTFESQGSANLTFTGVSLRKNLTDVNFARLGSVIPAMVTMDLAASAITDRSIALLAPARSLRMLRLSETAITDAALGTVAQLPSLESLNLFGTAVTDAGVAKLSSLRNLKRLYLWQTSVSQAAIADLRKSLPSLEIVTGL